MATTSLDRDKSDGSRTSRSTSVVERYLGPLSVARAAWRSGKGEIAAEALNRLAAGLRAEPVSPERNEMLVRALVILGRIHSQRSDHKSTIVLLDEAVNVAGNDDDLWDEIAYAKACSSDLDFIRLYEAHIATTEVDKRARHQSMYIYGLELNGLHSAALTEVERLLQFDLTLNDATEFREVLSALYRRLTADRAADIRELEDRFNSVYPTVSPDNEIAVAGAGESRVSLSYIEWLEYEQKILHEALPNRGLESIAKEWVTTSWWLLRQYPFEALPVLTTAPLVLYVVFAGLSSGYSTVVNIAFLVLGAGLGVAHYVVPPDGARKVRTATEVLFACFFGLLAFFSLVTRSWDTVVWPATVLLFAIAAGLAHYLYAIHLIKRLTMLGFSAQVASRAAAIRLMGLVGIALYLNFFLYAVLNLSADWLEAPFDARMLVLTRIVYNGLALLWFRWESNQVNLRARVQVAFILSGLIVLEIALRVGVQTEPRVLVYKMAYPSAVFLVVSYVSMMRSFPERWRVTAPAFAAFFGLNAFILFGMQWERYLPMEWVSSALALVTAQQGLVVVAAFGVAVWQLLVMRRQEQIARDTLKPSRSVGSAGATVVPADASSAALGAGLSQAPQTSGLTGGGAEEHKN